MGKFFRGPLIYIIIIVVIILAAQFLGNPGTTTIDELKYTEFLQKVQDKDIKDIAIQDRNIVGRYASSEIPDDVFPQQYDFSATMPTIDQFNKDIAAITGTNNPEQYGFVLNYIPTAEPNFFMQLLPYLIPVSYTHLVFYAIGVCVSAFFLVNAGASEQEALELIPDYKES